MPGLSRDGLFKDFTSGLERLKYRVDFGVLDSVDFGVSQRRRRLGPTLHAG